MTTPIPGRTWVESAPPIEPYRYGLLSVAQIADGVGNWQAYGVEYFSDACAQGGHVPGACPAPLPTEDQTATVTATPDATADEVTLTAPVGNDMTLNWALVSATESITGSIAPGETITELPVPPGEYALQVQVPGYPADEAPTTVTVPGGEPATATYTIPADPNAPGTTHDKPVTQGLDLVQSSPPVTVYARAECNAIGPFTDPQATARRRLALIENREVERYFSRYVLGAIGVRLPAGATATTTLKRAVGLLERDAALFYGGTPTLHAVRWTNPYFRDRSLLQDNRDTQPVLRTGLDSRVAFGGGYYEDPFAPDIPPADPDAFWLVATGSVRAFRSEVFVNETFTPATNIRLAIAERTYVFDTDCYRAAVLVDLTGEA